MQEIGLISGVAELVLSLVLGLMVTFVSFRLFGRIYRELNEKSGLAENNVSVAIVLASMVLGTGVVVLQSLAPMVSTFQTTIYNGLTVESGLTFVGYVLGFALGALFVAILGISLATRVFLFLTHEIDEMAEIRQNNMAVAIALAAVILVISLFLGFGTKSFLLAIVPYPSITGIEVIGG